MNNSITQGALANQSGKILEQTIVPMMKNLGYKVVPFSEVKKNPNLKDEEKIVITNFPFTSIYNHTGKTEYVVINAPKGRKIRVEAKNQQSAGSVDEKLPNLFLNAIYSYPETEIVLLIEGNGWKTGALNWIKNAVNEYNENFNKYKDALRILQPMFAKNKELIVSKKSISIMNLSEFLSFFLKELA